MVGLTKQGGRPAEAEPDHAGHGGLALAGLALFDFDGTITSRDSLPLFILHTNSGLRTCARALAFFPALARYCLGSWDNQKAKEALLALYYKHWPQHLLKEAGADFAEKAIPKIIRPKALDRIAWHRSAGHRVMVVSASPEEWIGPWAKGQGLEYLATRLKYNDGGLFSGFFEGLNCHGPEKVRRVREQLGDLENFHIYAYGDSQGDREMLNLANEPFYKPFRK